MTTDQNHTPALVALSSALVEESSELMKKRARSFRWGWRLMQASEQRDVAIVYGFCRRLDDLADREMTDTERAETRVELGEIAAEVRGERPARDWVAAFRDVTHRRRIPLFAALDLVEGCTSDLDLVRLADDRALIRYAYQVAGTVGLMMAAIIGAEGRDAAGHATDLGIAMQLTNISRDVAEDARANRVYLPRSRLQQAGVDPEALVAGHAPADRTYQVVRALLDLAEARYASGFEGLRYIPRRHRLAIAVAARIYRAIGKKIVRTGPRAIATRTVVGPLEKVVHAMRGLLDVVWPTTGIRAALTEGAASPAEEAPPASGS